MANWKSGIGDRKTLLLALLLLAGCSSAPRQPAPVAGRTPQAAGQPSPYSCSYTPRGNGGFYKDDGPLDLPAGINDIPEPLPRAEPLHRWANNPYSVLGQDFTPTRTVGELRQRGTASWYGRKFHGQKTSSGETYDMFQMTAAHPTLPIPSYARVTSLKNGRSVIVRINDRGPFLKGRAIDLSFLAACRLGYAMNGSTEVEVVSLAPGEAMPGPTMLIAAKPAPAETSALPAPTRNEPATQLTGNEVFLQLGAFGSRANAENFHAHLARELDDPQTARLVIHQAGPLYRVRLGPFPDRATALAEAEKLTGQKLNAIVTR